jgi:hypothetical protein
MKPRARDSKGRFVKKVKPAPELLDAATLRTLGEGRRPQIIMAADHELFVTIYHPKVAPSADE